MTKIKTKIIAAIFAWALSLTSFAHAASIVSVSVGDANTLKVTLSGAQLQAAPTGEVKILKDMSVTSATKDPVNTKVVNLSLAWDLVAGKSYSLISIFGAEGSMDFSLGKSVSNVDIPNQDKASTSIEKIVVKDSKNVSVYFKAALTGSEFEFKILSNLGVESIGADIDGSLLVKASTAIEPNKAYILMVVSLKDAAGKDITVDDGIYDFTSSALTSAPATGTWVVASPLAPNPGATGTWVVAAQGAPNPGATLAPTGTGSAELNAAAASSNAGKVVAVDNGNVEKVALNAAKTPATGPETWIIILATLFINSSLYLYRRKA